jgi:serine/threonine protein kinase
MLTGRVPWDEQAFDNPMQAILYIAQDGRVPKLPTPISNELNDFLLLCFNREYKMRPTAEELIQHPFFKLN